MIINEYMIFGLVLIFAFAALMGGKLVGIFIDVAVPDSVFSDLIPGEDLRESYKRHRRKY